MISLKLHSWLSTALATIIFALAIIAVVPSGIEGDITLFRIAKFAQGWQTLIAAIVAFIAAGVAYRGAMAKVEFDRSSVRQALIARKVGLFRRTISELTRLEYDCTFWADQIPKSVVLGSSTPNWKNVAPDSLVRTQLVSALASAELLPKQAVALVSQTIVGLEIMDRRLKKLEEFMQGEPIKQNQFEMAQRFAQISKRTQAQIESLQIILVKESDAIDSTLDNV